MKLLSKFAKCQNLSIWQQIQKGVTMFDIRIRPYTLEVAHGLVEYNCNVRDVFETLEVYAQSTDTPIYVRLCLENKTSGNRDEEIQWFKNKFKQYVEEYPDIHFCGGYVKHPWEKVIEVEDPDYVEAYWTFMNFTNEHTTFGKIKKFIKNLFTLNPEYHAKKDNREHVVKYYNTDKYVMLDFIEYELY